MGLDTTHDCYCGGYHTFNFWRIWLATKAGIPLNFMEGHNRYYVSSKEVDEFKEKLISILFDGPIYSAYQVLRSMKDVKSIPWNIISDDLKIILDHSDCDGCIKWYHCRKLAIRLWQIMKQCKLPEEDRMYQITKKFALGLCQAYKAQEHVQFM